MHVIFHIQLVFCALADKRIGSCFDIEQAPAEKTLQSLSDRLEDDTVVAKAVVNVVSFSTLPSNPYNYDEDYVDELSGQIEMSESREAVLHGAYNLRPSEVEQQHRH